MDRQSDEKLEFRRVVPSLLAKDLDGTQDFYRRLGFEVSGTHPGHESPTWTELRRGEVAIQFYSQAPRGTPQDPLCSGALYVQMEGVSALAKEWQGKVPFAWGPEVMDYGMHEFGIQDPNGYFLAFTEPADESSGQAD